MSAPGAGVGLRTRLLVAFLVPAFSVLALGGYGLFRASRNALEDELGRSLADLAATVSSQLKADRVLALTPEDAAGEGSRTFRNLKSQLDEVRTAGNLRRVLVVDLERRARLDVGGTLPPMAEAPELFRDELELKRVFAGEQTASQVLFEGNDGRTYKTGYAPLRLDGKVVGAVAVEGTAAFFGPLKLLRNALVLLFVVTLALLAVAAVLVAQALSRPLDQLVASALRIGGGDLSTKVEPAPTREIGILSRELEAMRAALESRDRQLKMMLGGVAHEVRNPLGGMELFSGLLAEELASGKPDLTEAKGHVEKVRRELTYLGRLVEDFLVYARDQKLNATPVEVQALTDAAVGHVAGEAKARAVTVEVLVEAATVTLDQGLMTSVLVNLLKNAVQISKAGQKVHARGRRDGAHYLLTVEDEGPGIAPEQQERIFEPFFTTREKGAGLGLPLARKLTEAHGGRLSVASRPGKTEFTVSLPLGGS